MAKQYIKLVALAAMFGVNANAQQLQNSTFDAEWVKCYPWEKGDYSTSDKGTQPEGWCVSNVPNIKMVITITTPEVAEVIDRENDGDKAIKLSNVTMSGQTIPAYMTLGTTWATAETKGTNDVRNEDGGAFGGIPFTYHPDAIQLQYKHDTTNGEEQMSVIAYLWKGTWTQADVPSNTAVGLISWGTATKVAMTDRANNILDKECLQGGEITKSEDAALIASVETYIPEAVGSWTTLTAELNYGEYAGQPVDVEKLNIIISASDFFGPRGNIVAGNSVCIDNVKLLYYHDLKALAYEGADIDFAEGTYAYELPAVTAFDPAKLSYTVKGQGATATTNYNEETHLLTIRVEGEDFATDSTAFTEYTIQFGFEPEPEPVEGDIDGDGEVKINDITKLINIYLQGK